MTLRAHRTLLGRLGATRKEADASFRCKVEPGLRYARHLGSAYGASNFVCLLGLLASAPDLGTGDRISFFAYGSGCQGEFFEGVVGPAARARVAALDLDGHLESRRRVPFEAYTVVERAREARIDARDYTPVRDGFYADAYAGQGWLVLERVEGYRREYGRS
jgi:hydroxymethylglutaryl-CoA synthase